MGTQELQALINQTQAELDAAEMQYDTEKGGVERRISEIHQAVEFNRNQANSIRQNGGDEMSANDFENKANTLESELPTQQQNMELALSRKKQEINAIKSRFEQQSAQYDEAEQREKIMGFVQTFVRYAS